MRISETEARLRDWARSTLPPPGATRDWVGFPPSTFLSPYLELEESVRSALRLAHEQSRNLSSWVDLGAGYGRLGFVLGAVLGRENPDSRLQFVGYELVPERVEAASAALTSLVPWAHLVTQDLSASDFTLPIADVYFCYDFGAPDHLLKSFGELQALAFRGHAFTLIARGGLCRNLISRYHPWLEVEPPVHGPNVSIYHSLLGS